MSTADQDQQTKTVQLPSEQQPVSMAKALELGMARHHQGDLAGADGIYRLVLKADPNQPDALHLLGVIAFQTGNLDAAIDLIGKALRIKPEFPKAHNNMGNVLKSQNKLEEAALSYQQAFNMDPGFEDAHFNLGVVFQDLNKLDEAAASYQKAISLNPEFVDAYNNLGATFQKLKKLDEAADSFKKALALNPKFSGVHNNLGIVLKDQNKPEEALTSFQSAVSINPNYAEAYSNSGATLRDMNQLDEAVAQYHKAITLNPDYAEAHKGLGMTLMDQGNVANAIAEYDLAISQKPENAGWKIRRALALPVIATSVEEIQTSRDDLIAEIDRLQSQNLTIDDPLFDVGVTNFQLAYHCQNNKSILERIAKLHLSACPKLNYLAKHCQTKTNEAPKKLRIGFVSAFMRRHTVGKLSQGYIEHFDREKFDVVLFQIPGKRDGMTDVIERAADHVVPLHKQLDRDWDIIAAQELDCLFYLDIGMDPYTYFLSFARLAPVQAVTIGHAESSGVPNIDYFLSSQLTEPTDGAEHYSEQLVKLSYLPTYYYRPEMPYRVYTRSDYELPDGPNLYVYPQTLFKLHPSFDETLGEILRRDPDGRLVCIDDGMGGHLNKRLIARLGQSCPDVVDRILFVPKMPYEKFLGLLSLADAILDNPFLSGTNSGLEAFGVGAPIVAWSGRYCSGNCVTACYKQMGLSDLIATDEQGFIERALRLAQDKEFQAQMRNDVNTNSDKLFERIELVREIESFFVDAYKASQKGEKLAL